MRPVPPRPLPLTDPGEIRLALAKVEERDRRLIELRYGLKGGPRHSRAEVAQLMGISRERVRQLEKRALDRLEAPHDRGAEGPPPPKRQPATRDEPSRRSYLRAWILLLLHLQPAHVYELRARLRELGLPPANYRLLQALEGKGLLCSTWAPGRGAGPSRRVYSLTPLGTDQLRRDAQGLRAMATLLNRFLEQPKLSSPPPFEPGSGDPRSG